MKYEQSLYKIVEPIRSNAIKRLNKSRKWEYGYNKENDVIVISKTGTVGEVVEIQGLQIALPKQPKEIYSCSKDKAEQVVVKLETAVPSFLSARYHLVHCCFIYHCFCYFSVHYLFLLVRVAADPTTD